MRASVRVRKLVEVKLVMTMKMKVVSLDEKTPKICCMPRTIEGPSRAKNEPVGPKNRVQLKFFINQNSKYEIGDLHLVELKETLSSIV